MAATLNAVFSLFHTFQLEIELMIEWSASTSTTIDYCTEETISKKKVATNDYTTKG